VQSTLAPNSPRGGGLRELLLVVGVCCVTLIGGFALKAQCLGPWDGRQFSRLCYNDIQPLYYARRVSTTFPYVHGRLKGDQLRRGAIEYPVLTGLFMYESAHMGSFLPFLSRADASSGNEYLYESALLLAPFALAIAWLLVRMAGKRAFLWAAAPALVLYAFHNWDLLVVAATVVGWWCWQRERAGWAAFWFAIGAAFKLYPILFLAPLTLERILDGDRKGAVRVVMAGVLPVALINLPFVLINRSGWLATYSFHEARWADYNSIWAWFVGAHVAGITLPVFGVKVLNGVTAALTGAFVVVALLSGWMEERRSGNYPTLQVSAAMLASFLLWNKVHSPQYALWILPFFVLLNVNWWWWVAYALADLMIYVGIFRWFYDFVYGGLDFTWAKRVLILGVWARAILLLALFVVFLLARVARGVREDPHAGSSALASHPSPNVPGVGEALSV
jgi:uncharacterized membrane protein